MQSRRNLHIVVLAVLAVALASSVLLVRWHPAFAYQNEPTVTPQRTVTQAQRDLPYTQGDLARFTASVARPNGMVWLNDEIFVVCAGDQTVYRLYGTTGVTDTYIYGVTDAHMLYAEEQENRAVHLWVPDYETGELLRVTPTSVDTIASGMFGPWGITYLSPTTFLVSTRITGRVELVTRRGERTSFIEGLSQPTGLDHNFRYLYVANSGNTDRAVEWYYLQAARNNERTEEHLLIGGLSNVMSVRVGPDGKLYVAYEEDGRGVIGRVDPDECRSQGGCTADEVERVVVTRMEAPLAGLTFAPDGRLFFHERYGESLYWVRIAE